jgi:hypothetical protein
MVFNVSLSDIVVLLVTAKGATRENQQPVLYIVVHPFVLLFFFQLYCMFFFHLRLLITFFGIVKLFLLPSSSVAMLIVTVKG